MFSINCPVHKAYIYKRRTAIINQLFGEENKTTFYNVHTGIDFKTKSAFRYMWDTFFKTKLFERSESEKNGLVPIVAAHSGYLTVGYNDDKAEGIIMRIRSDEYIEYESMYFHLDKLRRWKGDLNKDMDSEKGEDYVSKGAIIGWGGNTGKWTTGAHLHFELRKDGERVDPITYFKDNIIYHRYAGTASRFFYHGVEISRERVKTIL